jgi:hypothetical protein
MAMTIPPNPRFHTQLTVHAPAADTNAVVTLAAVSGQRHVITKIDISYSAVTGAAITVTGLDGDDYSIVPTAAGVFQLEFDHPLIGTVGTAVVVTAAITTGTVKLNVQHAQ